jgi:hypothetical protein
MQIDDAVDRMSYLIGVGKLPALAAVIAAEEYGLEGEEVARAAAARKARYDEERRESDGRFTQESARRFLREHLAGHSEIDRDVRRAVARVFYNTMIATRAERNIGREFLDATEGLEDDALPAAFKELYRLWSLLPPLYDPRPTRRTDVTRESFMWPSLQTSPFYRWWPRG